MVALRRRQRAKVPFFSPPEKCRHRLLIGSSSRWFQIAEVPSGRKPMWLVHWDYCTVIHSYMEPHLRLVQKQQQVQNPVVMLFYTFLQAFALCPRNFHSQFLDLVSEPQVQCWFLALLKYTLSLLVSFCRVCNSSQLNKLPLSSCPHPEETFIPLSKKQVLYTGWSQGLWEATDDLECPLK